MPADIPPKKPGPKPAPKPRRPPDALSRERIRQIERMALRKLRLQLTLKGIQRDDLLPD
jgi:hypothetical protein